jgi:hypothetical protein
MHKTIATFRAYSGEQSCHFLSQTWHWQLFHHTQDETARSQLGLTTESASLGTVTSHLSPQTTLKMA